MKSTGASLDILTVEAFIRLDWLISSNPSMGVVSYAPGSCIIFRWATMFDYINTPQGHQTGAPVHLGKNTLAQSVLVRACTSTPPEEDYWF